MKTSIEQVLEWLWNRKPDIAFFVIIGACIVWITSTVINVNVTIETLKQNQAKSGTEAEKIRQEMDERFKAVDQRFDKIDIELFEIRLMLKKIDTYLTTTSSTYK